MSRTEIDRVKYGYSAGDLAQLFGGTPSSVQKKIDNRVRPCSAPDVRPPRYRMRDVAPYLVDFNVDADTIENTIKNMTPEKLPAKLSDVFWKGQKARLDYQERQGDLWKTERVVQVFVEAFKPISVTIKMFRDTVGQMSELTPKQREILQELSDGLLRDLQSSLIDKFKDYHPHADEHGMPINEEEELVKITVEDDGFDDL